jgi:hypothetical protein
MRSKFVQSAILACTIGFAGSASAFSTTPESDANNLLTALLGTTTGLSGISASISGDPGASGTFAADPFGLGAGVILSTGLVGTVVGPNNSPSAGSDLGAGGSVGDTTTLTIGFTSDATVSNLFFNYVFGSEEFLEFIGSSFNDFFTLKLDGTNFAKLVCGSDVAINNFVGACFNELVNNTGGLVTQLDYYTNKLLFQAPLSAGAHTLELSIGDVGDGVLDSAVFVQGNVGTENPTPTPEPASLSLLGLGLAALVSRRFRAAKSDRS